MNLEVMQTFNRADRQIELLKTNLKEYTVLITHPHYSPPLPSLLSDHLLAS